MSAISKTGHSVFFNSLIVSLGVCVGFFSAPADVSAQESIVLDFSNPNVIVDFSVLKDSGIGRITTNSPSARSTSGGHLIPGPNAPVSTLYITPANNFAKADNEDVTKYKFKFVAPVVAKKDIPAAPPPPPVAKINVAPVKEPIKNIEEKSATELAKEEVVAPPEPAVIEKPKEMAKKIISAEPAPPKAPPPPPEPAPAPAPVPVKPVAKAPIKAPEPVAEPVIDQPLKLEAKKVEEKIAPPPPAVKITEPAKVVAKLPEEVKEAPSVASLPPTGATISDGYSMRVLFEPETAKLPADARNELRELATNMANQEDLRLQLLAYAGGAKMSSSVARRLSLSRALAVRSYLIESGVRSTRIDVRALGNKTSHAETERVDITVIER